TSFPRVTLCCGITQEILQRLEYERPEPSTTPIGTIEETTFKHHYKKILCQVLSIGNGVALAADEGENRSPINFAKRGQRGARLFLVVARIGTGKYHAPARRQEAVGPLGPAWGADWFQGRRLLHGRIYETSRKTSYLLRPVARALKGARTKDLHHPSTAFANRSSVKSETPRISRITRMRTILIFMPESSYPCHPCNPWFLSCRKFL